MKDFGQDVTQNIALIQTMGTKRADRTTLIKSVFRVHNTQTGDLGFPGVVNHSSTCWLYGKPLNSLLIFPGVLCAFCCTCTELRCVCVQIHVLSLFESLSLYMDGTAASCTQYIGSLTIMCSIV